MEKEEVRKKIESLRNSNTDKVKAIESFGQMIDPAMIADMKIDVFLQTFCTEDQREVFMYNMQVALNKALNETLSALRQQQLLQGVSTTRLEVPRG